MQQYNAQSARDYLSNRKRAVKDIATPWWSEKDSDGNEIGLDGHVQIRKISAHEGFQLDAIDDEEQKAGLLLSMALVLKDTGEPMFQVTGLSEAMGINLDEMRSLVPDIKRFNGLLPGAVEDAKKNLPTTQTDNSVSS